MTFAGLKVDTLSLEDLERNRRVLVDLRRSSEVYRRFEVYRRSSEVYRDLRWSSELYRRSEVYHASQVDLRGYD